MPKKVEVKVEVKEVVSKILDLSWDNLEVAEEQPQEPVCFEGLGEEAAEVHQWIRNEMEYRDLSHSKIPEPGSEVRELEIDRVAAVLQEDTTRIYRELLCQAFGLTPEQLDSSNSIDAERMLEIARDIEIVNIALASERLAAEHRTGLNPDTTLNDFCGLRSAIRELVDSVMASFDTFFKACSFLFEVRVLCVWDEFVWKRTRRWKMKRRKRENGMETQKIPDHSLRYAWRPGMTEAEWNALRARGQTAAIRSRPYNEFLLHYELNFNSEFDQFPSGALDLGTLTEEETDRFREQWFREMHTRIALCTPSRFGLTGRQ